MLRGSVRCSKRSRIATASWSAPKADPEAFRQNGLFHCLERVYPSARASLASERSAARLAHRSGGPGVGSSNLPAPTTFPIGFPRFPSAAATAVGYEIGTKGHQSSRTGTNSPEIFPNDVHATFDHSPKRADAVQIAGFSSDHHQVLATAE